MEAGSSVSKRGGDRDEIRKKTEGFEAGAGVWCLKDLEPDLEAEEGAVLLASFLEVSIVHGQNREKNEEK